MTHILITGVNRGIGKSMVFAALAKGWTIYGSCRNQNTADAIAAEFGENFIPLVFDVTDHEAAKNAAEMIDGPIDILINNAGIIGPEDDNQSSLNMDYQGFAKTLEVNTLAPLAMSQIFLDRLRKSDAPRILTISSQMGYMGYAKSDRVAYRASKSAVNKVMQCLATDLHDDNISVALIDPGWVVTDMGGDDAELNVDDVAKGIIDVADQLSMAQSGKFIEWNGKERAF